MTTPQHLLYYNSLEQMMACCWGLFRMHFSNWCNHYDKMLYPSFVHAGKLDENSNSYYSHNQASWHNIDCNTNYNSPVHNFVHKDPVVRIDHTVVHKGNALVEMDDRVDLAAFAIVVDIVVVVAAAPFHWELDWYMPQVTWSQSAFVGRGYLDRTGAVAVEDWFVAAAAAVANTAVASVVAAVESLLVVALVVVAVFVVVTAIVVAVVAVAAVEVTDVAFAAAEVAIPVVSAFLAPVVFVSVLAFSAVLPAPVVFVVLPAHVAFPTHAVFVPSLGFAAVLQALAVFVSILPDADFQVLAASAFATFFVVHPAPFAFASASAFVAAAFLVSAN